MSSQTVNISIPTELVKKVDILAKHNYTSRSDIIRQALLHELELQTSQADQWETIVDFSHLPQGGLPGEEFLARLKKL